jgi:hypothetical protein
MIQSVIDLLVSIIMSSAFYQPVKHANPTENDMIAQTQTETPQFSSKTIESD